MTNYFVSKLQNVKLPNNCTLNFRSHKQRVTICTVQQRMRWVFLLRDVHYNFQQAQREYKKVIDVVTQEERLKIRLLLVFNKSYCSHIHHLFRAKF